MSGDWLSSRPQAPSTQSLKTARKAVNRSVGCSHHTRHMPHAAWSAKGCTCGLLTHVHACRLLAVQRGLPARSFSAGASQLIKVMVKESVVATREARQRSVDTCVQPEIMGLPPQATE